ncbi:hypothetical protein AtNW77_Chr5g0110861 [Arabidopsis thaliana]|uniref:S-protein homolog n=2 Tax=Arabidopsis TaxID=3701 RepID=A0A178U6P0_ARATH|nr:hypothetical protein ISN45_At05g024710 [Arabidopsis thaliana x Arabidopsis arenosa]OAO89578.1 hypothetical protein AXX17_AT5G26090 [Arabidopsis thaliana]
MENKLVLGALCIYLVLQGTCGEENNPLINHYVDYETIHPSEYYSSDFELKDGTNVIFEAINELKGIKKPKAGFMCNYGKKQWTRSLPGDIFYAKFFFYSINPNVKVVQHCHFRSNLGYVDAYIKITPALGRTCPGYRCVLAIRREGLLMKDTNELFPWTPWPRRHIQPKLPKVTN